MKPRASFANVEAYRRISELPEGTQVDVDGTKAVFTGMLGYLLTFKVNGKKVNVRIGDPVYRGDQVARVNTPTYG